MEFCYEHFLNRLFFFSTEYNQFQVKFPKMKPFSGKKPYKITNFYVMSEKEIIKELIRKFCVLISK